MHLQYYQRCEPMILKMSVKSKFVLWQPRYYNLLTEKKDKKIHDFDLKKLSSNNIFRWYTFGKFWIVKFNYFSGRPSFEIFLIDH